MTHRSQSISLLITEDDHEDCLFVEEAFKDSCPDCNLVFVHDGAECMHYLNQSVAVDHSNGFVRPDLILLDLRLPRVGGFEVLVEIKSDPKFRSIPVVVLTKSSSDQDIRQAYDLGAAGFIIKPDTYDGLLQVARAINEYWFEVVELASSSNPRTINHHFSNLYTLE
jgi:CheY-like chemotaxis protein